MDHIEILEPASTARRQPEIRRISEPVLVLREETYRLSWLAYFRPFFVFLLRGMLASMAKFYAMWLAEVLVVGCLAWLVFDIFSVRRVRLVVNEQGVWVESGLLPWTRGARGIKWRDIGSAGYFTGFLPWALRSYKIVVTHRFTTDAELVLKHVHLGNKAVEHINSIQADGTR
jgi:hypothetical protein